MKNASETGLPVYLKKAFKTGYENGKPTGKDTSEIIKGEFIKAERKYYTIRVSNTLYLFNKKNLREAKARDEPFYLYFTLQELFYEQEKIELMYSIKEDSGEDCGMRTQTPAQLRRLKAVLDEIGMGDKTI